VEQEETDIGLSLGWALSGFTEWNPLGVSMLDQ